MGSQVTGSAGRTSCAGVRATMRLLEVICPAASRTLADRTSRRRHVAGGVSIDMTRIRTCRDPELAGWVRRTYALMRAVASGRQEAAGPAPGIGQTAPVPSMPQ